MEKRLSWKKKYCLIGFDKKFKLKNLICFSMNY